MEYINEEGEERVLLLPIRATSLSKQRPWDLPGFTFARIKVDGALAMWRIGFWRGRVRPWPVTQSYRCPNRGGLLTWVSIMGFGIGVEVRDSKNMRIHRL